MAYSSVYILTTAASGGWPFTNSNVFTITISTSSYPDVKTFIQNIWKEGGAWAVDASLNEVWLPVGAIERVAYS